MRTILIISLGLAFGLAQTVPLAPANAATTVQGSKSNPSQFKHSPPPPVHHHRGTTVKGSKSNGASF